MVDTEKTRDELLTIFADSQPAGSIDPQDMRDYVVTTDINSLSTSLIDGGIVTINGDATKIDIAAGTGVYIDMFTDPMNPVRKYVSWTAFLAEPIPNILTTVLTTVGLNLSSGTAVVEMQNVLITDEYRRDFIPLVIAGHTAMAVVENLVPLYTWAFDTQQTLRDMSLAVGIINIDGGNIYSGNSDLTVDKTAGSTFNVGSNYANSKKIPNTTTDIAQAPVTPLLYTYQDGGGDFILTAPQPGNAMDPDFWDDGTGTLNTVGNNLFTIQRFYWVAGFVLTVVHYGQTEYSNMEDALLAINTEEFNFNPLIVAALFRGWLVVQQGASNLSLPADAKFLSAGRFGDVLRDI